MESEEKELVELAKEERYLPAARDSTNLASPGKNILLAVCLDGSVHSIDETNGKVIWKEKGEISSGSVLRSSTDTKPPSEYVFVVEPSADGQVYLLENEAKEEDKFLHKLPFTLKSLVENSPLRLPDGSIYIAKKESKVLRVSLRNGRVYEDADGQNDYILLGRTVYHVQSFEVDSVVPSWDVVFTRFTSVNIPTLHEANRARPKSDIQYFTTFDGHLMARSKKSDKSLNWLQRFPSPILQLFRLTGGQALLSHDLNLEEIPLSSSKSFDFKRQMLHYDRAESTFYFDDLVNLGVTEGNMLYVLPQSKYPLVSLKSGQLDAETQDQLSNSSEIILYGERKESRVLFPRNCTTNDCFVGTRRVLKAMSPISMPLLDSVNESKVTVEKRTFWKDESWTGQLITSLVIILLGTITFYWLRKLFKEEKKPESESLIQSPSVTSKIELTDTILGYGSQGTIVYRGSFDGRPVAVKRLLLDFFDLAGREISLLQESDDHPHVVRYFYREQNDQFMFICLELATGTLADLIEGPSGMSSGSQSNNSSGEMRRGTSRTAVVDVETLKNTSPMKRELLYQMMLGLEHLHSLKLVHRDLKPQNILLVPSSIKSQLKVVISDFGLSKKLQEDQTSFHATVHSGTLGWRAPECILNDESASFIASQQESASDASSPKTLSTPSSSGTSSATYGPVKVGRSVDIFAAGLIFHYVLTDGQHPFGQRLQRESNIALGRLNISDELAKCDPTAVHLIEWMLEREARNRPNAKQVLEHPWFWSSEKQLAFIAAISDRLEVEERKILSQVKPVVEPSVDAPPGFSAPQPSNNRQTLDSPLFQAIESRRTAIFPASQFNWMRMLPRPVFLDLTKHRYYNPTSIQDLLRAIRNKRNHFQETPGHIREIVGSDLDSFWKYFEKLFPALLIEVWRAAGKRELGIRSELVFKDIFYF